MEIRTMTRAEFAERFEMEIKAMSRAEFTEHLRSLAQPICEAVTARYGIEQIREYGGCCGPIDGPTLYGGEWELDLHWQRRP